MKGLKENVSVYKKRGGFGCEKKFTMEFFVRVCIKFPNLIFFLQKYNFFNPTPSYKKSIEFINESYVMFKSITKSLVMILGILLKPLCQSLSQQHHPRCGHRLVQVYICQVRW